MWTAEARTKTEVARVMIRVGAARRSSKVRIPPAIVIGGFIGLVAIAVWYRFCDGRNQRRQP